MKTNVSNRNINGVIFINGGSKFGASLFIPSLIIFTSSLQLEHLQIVL